MLKICKYVMYDILRSKVIILYALLLLCISYSLFYIEEDQSKSLVSLLSIVIIIVPLVSVIFSATYFYNAYEFLELLVAQPISRSAILLGEYLGVSAAMLIAGVVGIILPVLLFVHNSTALMLSIATLALTLAFVSLAFLAAVSSREKARGIGLALLVWFYFAVIYDGLVLALLFAFNDYPLEKVVVALAALNPIDLGRIIVLLKLDISALMGFTGAVYQDLFGNGTGLLISLLVLAAWIVVPILFAIRIFYRKNL